MYYIIKVLFIYECTRRVQRGNVFMKAAERGRARHAAASPQTVLPPHDGRPPPRGAPLGHLLHHAGAPPGTRSRGRRTDFFFFSLFSRFLRNKISVVGRWRRWRVFKIFQTPSRGYSHNHAHNNMWYYTFYTVRAGTKIDILYCFTCPKRNLCTICRRESLSKRWITTTLYLDTNNIIIMW